MLSPGQASPLSGEGKGTVLSTQRVVLGLSSGNLYCVRALSLWVEKGLGTYVGIVLGLEDGKIEAGSSASQAQACGRHSQSCPILPFVFLWLAKTPGPLALAFTPSLTILPLSYFLSNCKIIGFFQVHIPFALLFHLFVSPSPGPMPCTFLMNSMFSNCSPLGSAIPGPGPLLLRHVLSL